MKQIILIIFFLCGCQDTDKFYDTCEIDNTNDISDSTSDLIYQCAPKGENYLFRAYSNGLIEAWEHPGGIIKWSSDLLVGYDITEIDCFPSAKDDGVIYVTVNNCGEGTYTIRSSDGAFIY